MCGIAGICRYQGNGVDEIQLMNQAMKRRGPDSGDYWLEEKEGVVLGHRRLAIVDLSENGAQPMVSLDGRYVISFNGEIYNCQDIIYKMKKDGYSITLRGSSDTEVVLNAFVCYGVRKTLALMKGMFSIALWDRTDKVLWLMRDRMGEKPLYYGRVKNSFVFASDLASIKVLEGFDNPVNQDVLPLYFQYGYIPAPYSIYQNIYKVKPGCYLKIAAPFLNEPEIHSYYSVDKAVLKGQRNLYQGTQEEAAEHLEVLLKDAIEGQMMADVSLGAFLSGGIDSALIVSLMQSLSKEQVKTFTIGFESTKYNEAEFAAQISAHLGTKHTELYVGKKEAMGVIHSLKEAFSEPFADSSQIPTMLVSKMTREHVTVSLSGDAGDELFCGYNTYRVASDEWSAFLNRFGKIPKRVRHLMGSTAKSMAGPYNSFLYKMGNYFTMDSPVEAHRRIGLEDSRTPFLSYGKEILEHSNTQYRFGQLLNLEDDLMLMDLMQYHTDDILVKVDRAAMYYSLETRIPFLDKDVMEFAFSLPLSYKYSDGITKRILKNILYKHVPRSMMERNKKGFSIPMSEWLCEGELREWAEDLLARGRRDLNGILNTKVIDSLWKEYLEKGKWTEKIWYVLMMEQWML